MPRPHRPRVVPAALRQPGLDQQVDDRRQSVRPADRRSRQVGEGRLQRLRVQRAEVPAAEERLRGGDGVSRRLGIVDQLGHLARECTLRDARFGPSGTLALERLDLLARAEAEDAQIGAHDAVVGVQEPLVEGERARERRVQPQRRPRALPELLAVGPVMSGVASACAVAPSARRIRSPRSGCPTGRCRRAGA